MDIDSTIETHGNSFEKPPRFVGESNSTNTLPPSRENVADCITGGVGSESALKTLNVLPRGYSITYRTFGFEEEDDEEDDDDDDEVESDNFTATLYNPGL
jgi:hypothetical protein